MATRAEETATKEEQMPKFRYDIEVSGREDEEALNPKNFTGALTEVIKDNFGEDVSVTLVEVL
jgi:adenylosuccinate lyase